MERHECHPRTFSFMLVVGIMLTLASSGRAADTVKGKVKNVSPDKGRLALTDTVGKRWTFKVPSTTRIYINNKEAKLSDLMVDDQAEVKYMAATAPTASEIRVTRRQKGRRGLSFTSAILKAADKTANGKIKSLSVDTMQFGLIDSAGKAWTFQVTAKTDIKLNDKNATLKDLMAGDSVIVRFSKQGEKQVASEVHVKRAR